LTTSGSDRVQAILSRFYDRRADEEPERDPEALLRFRKALDVAALRPRERVLDLGSKWGGLGVAMREAGLDVDYLGLDLGALNVRRAGELGLEVREADIASAELPVEDGSRDCVFCLELLEHLDSQLGLLHEIRRVLAPGGRAVISVPSPYNWIEIYRELRGRADPEGHLASLPTPVMINLLALAGLRIERRRGTFIRLPRTLRLIPADNLAARSRLYLVRIDDRAPFAGRPVGDI
jgi:SAM-dependent methyltransferase